MLKTISEIIVAIFVVIIILLDVSTNIISPDVHNYFIPGICAMFFTYIALNSSKEEAGLWYYLYWITGLSNAGMLIFNIITLN